MADPADDGDADEEPRAASPSEDGTGEATPDDGQHDDGDTSPEAGRAGGDGTGDRSDDAGDEGSVAEGEGTVTSDDSVREPDRSGGDDESSNANDGDAPSDTERDDDGGNEDEGVPGEHDVGGDEDEGVPGEHDVAAGGEDERGADDGSTDGGDGDGGDGDGGDGDESDGGKGPTGEEGAGARAGDDEDQDETDGEDDSGGVDADEDDENGGVSGVPAAFAEPDEVEGGTGTPVAERTTDTAEEGEHTPVETDGATGAVGHAPDDEEQPLEEHITEMIHRFLAVAVSMGGVAAIVLLWSDDLINFLWYSFLGPGQPLCPGQECPQTFKPHLYHPLSLVLARLKISVLVGFIVGLPVAVYQTYLFMRPGLYPRERRYYLAAVPTSLVLATVGVAFAYFLILPALFSYFVGYTTRAADPALGLAETFNIMVIMLGFFALVFQIPLLVMLAIMMGVTTRRWLEDRRLYFWMGFGGVAFIFSPDPTGMAPLLVALTMIALFEGTLMLLRWTGKDSPILAPEPLRARRPHAWVIAALAGYAVSGAPLPTSYYEYLPSEVTQILADLGWTTLTPLVVAVALVAAFEVTAHVLRRLGAGLRFQLWVYKVRWPVWIAAAFVGYLASPNPGVLEAARETALELPYVAAVVLGIVVAYELLVQVIVWRRG